MTPRRITLSIVGLPVKGKDVREERKARASAPPPALQGFLKRGARRDRGGDRPERPEEGRFLRCADRASGAPGGGGPRGDPAGHHQELSLAEGDALGRGLAQPGSLRWVRPLQSIVCTFGPETEEPEVVRFSVDGSRAAT